MAYATATPVRLLRTQVLYVDLVVHMRYSEGGGRKFLNQGCAKAVPGD